METAGSVLAIGRERAWAPSCSVRVLPVGLPTVPADVRDAWSRLDAANSHVYAMYQSLAWFEHLLATGQGAGTRVAVVEDDHRNIVGIVPMQLDQYPLIFSAGRRPLWKFRLRTAFVLGGQPRVPASTQVHERLFRSIWEAVPEIDALYMKGMPAEGPCWSHLQHGSTQGIVYAERGVRDFFTITLPATFDDYLAKFKQKKRYNLKRQVRVLREQGGGELELVRAESDAQIPAFLTEAKIVAQNSWEHRLAVKESDDWEEQERVEDLARRGFLRCYLLKTGGVPCAYVIGYQSQGIFHYSDIGYDQRFAQFSPGSVLLYLLIEDLINYRPPRLLNFGIGDSHYKSQFATDTSAEASVLLLRRTGPNQLKHAAHRLFRTAGRGAKRVLPRGLSAGPVAAEALEILAEF